jgi:hypothetical protein
MPIAIVRVVVLFCLAVKVPALGGQVELVVLGGLVLRVAVRC